MADGGVQMRSDIASVLAQMRTMRAAVDMPISSRYPGNRHGLNPSGGDNDFGSLLKASIDSVSSLQNESSAAGQRVQPR